MIDLDFLDVYNCHKNLVCHARSQSGSIFCNNTSLNCQKVVCPSSRSLESGGIELESHYSRHNIDTGRKKLPCFAQWGLNAMKNGGVWQSRFRTSSAS